MIKKIFIILLICIPVFAFADVSAGEILDKVCNTMHNHTSKWQDVMKLSAITIFGIFWAFETTWKITKSWFIGEYGKVWSFLLLRIIAGSFFYYWITNPAIWQGIIEYFIKIGSDAGGFKVGLEVGKFTLKPSTILNYSDQIDGALQKVLSDSGWSDLGQIMLINIESFFVKLCLLIMALTLTFTLLESYIVLSGGLALTGFAGSSWTMSYFQSYIRYAIAIGVKFMVICLIMGVFQADIQDSVLKVTQAIELHTMGLAFSEIVSKSFIFVCLTVMVPSMASSMLNGTINASIHTGLAVGGGLVGAGFSLAKAGGSGGSALFKAASVGTSLMTSKRPTEARKTIAEHVKSKISNSDPYSRESVSDKIDQMATNNSEQKRKEKSKVKLKEAKDGLMGSFGHMANAAKNMKEVAGVGGRTSISHSGPRIG